MTDIALFLSPDGTCADIGINNSDLAMDDGLTTAVLWSIMSNAPATLADALPPGADTNGWWGDAYLPPLPDGTADTWGSELWLLVRLTATQANANRIAAAIDKALAWMLKDGVAADITTTNAPTSDVGWTFTTAISWVGTGGAVVKKQYNVAWNATLGVLTPVKTGAFN